MRASGAGILSSRGWGLIGGGLFCIALAQVMGRKDLLTLGLFLLLLPVLAAVGLRFIAPKFTVHREFSPAVVEADSSAVVNLSVASPNGLGTRVRMRETLPARFGRSPEFGYPGRVQSSTETGQRSSRYQYHLRSPSRGQFVIGPVSAELSDPFGLSRHSRSLPGTDLLTVTPQAVQLPANLLTGTRGGDGLTATRQQANPSNDDVMTREYRHGDPLRRVHWPATARHGELMVRQEESVTTPEATLLLDHRWHSFGHPAPSARRGREEEHPELLTSADFEWAVVAAMSICSHLIERNFELRLLDVYGEPGLASSRSAPEPLSEEYAGPLGLASIAESLAAIELQETGAQGAFNDLLLDKLALNRQRGPLIAILGELSREEAQALAPAIVNSTAACAILIPAEGSHSAAAKATATQHTEAGAVLRQAGWRVLTANQHSSLASIWSYFDTRPLEELMPPEEHRTVLGTQVQAPGGRL